jgi:hypothetical protein
MLKLLPALTAGAAALLIAGAGASTAATPLPSLRMHLVEREAGVHFVDTGKRGLSAGDRNVIRSEILDPQGHHAGRGDIDCVVTGVGKHLGGVCHGVLTLADGQIVAEFAWDRTGTATRQAIVGGTGRYLGMRGQAVVDTSGSDEREPFTIELT